jgi:ABC-type Zn uptake system ZnuABC Zn-binding protein ZnuA
VSVQNKKIVDYDFLRGMYDDGFFPNFLVDKIKEILIALCEQIEKEMPQNPEALLKLTHLATEKINSLQDEFAENDSELETGAREVIGADFEYLVKAYGFKEIDIEDVIAPREW